MRRQRNLSCPGRPFAALLAAAVLGAALLLTACPAEQEPEVTTLVMKDNSFVPQVVRIPVGGTLRVVNEGRNPHNAVSVDGSWSTEQDLGRLAMMQGEISDVTLHEAGRYPFYCTFHATPDGRRGMVGVLVVGDAIGEAIVREPLGPPPTREPTGVVRRVPEEYPSIQDAVDAAAPGDLVLIGPGVYHEQVTVTTPSLVLRGTDRNAVILDGEFQRANGVEVLAADGVAVENMTARNYLLNGFYWTGVTGYRGSYLTAYNNADYGLYAFDSTDGVFEHSYASGSPDAGFYIGQCYPCRAILNRVIAENNALGYSGTNAGGDLFIVSSVWRRNMSGIVPNTLDSELLPPQRETTIAGNLIHDNNNLDAPAKRLAWPSFGNGVVVTAGVANHVERNLILDHRNHGVLVTPNLDQHFWYAIDNVVRNNTVGGSGRADLALVGPAGSGNCFSGNRARSSMPPGLQPLHGCEGLRLPLVGDFSTTTRLLGYFAEARREVYPSGEVAEQPPPPPQPQLPGGAQAPVRPAHEVFDSYAEVNVRDLASIPLPPEAAGLMPTRSPEVFVAGLAVAQPGFWHLLFGLYGYLLPIVLLAAWVSLAFWDLARRDDLGRGATLAWIAAILLIPILGVIAYHALGRAWLPGWLRAAVVGGGIAAYLLIVALGLVVGRVV